MLLEQTQHRVSVFNLSVRFGHFLSTPVLNPPLRSRATESFSNRISLFPLLSAQTDINPLSRGVELWGTGESYPCMTPCTRVLHTLGLGGKLIFSTYIRSFHMVSNRKKSTLWFGSDSTRIDGANSSQMIPNF